MPLPLVIEVTRGGLTESRHLINFAVCDGDGRLVASGGDICSPVFPRSAIKLIQALPLVESGAADNFSFTDEQLALACSSHSGEARHIENVSQMLAQAQIPESALGCGANWPMPQATIHAMVLAGQSPRPIHNECSGKHAGMLAFLSHQGLSVENYTAREHPMQQEVAAALGNVCDVDLAACPCGTDGCCVPTWAFPLKSLAQCFARLTTGTGLHSARAQAAHRLMSAARTHPFMVAGTGRFDTRLMTENSNLFVKSGAEGVLVATRADTGGSIALKCADGAARAAGTALIALLPLLPGWTKAETEQLTPLATKPIFNRLGDKVGEIRPAS